MPNTRKWWVLNKNRFKIVFIGWMVCITSLSLFSFNGVTDIDLSFPNTDKLAHYFFHLGMVFFGVLGFIDTFENKSALQNSLIKWLVFSFLYGLGIEFLQFLMPYGRMADFWDVMANLAGALTAVLLIKRYRLRIKKIK
ncbi:VanZ family protein [Croceitalea dokdonensis]|uniref:VanZ family protein n=1 Tax=Croceitalea dokdonensis TaxID=346188 RepID=UPI00155DD76C|nr:VanZ family protein [Croceitalea dokdonensis]